MKMDTVWQAKVADSAIGNRTNIVTLDVAGVEITLHLGLGLQWEDMTSWAALGGALYRAVLNPVIVVSILVSVWTAVTDPTTAGLGDSGQALTYKDPKRG